MIRRNAMWPSLLSVLGFSICCVLLPAQTGGTDGTHGGADLEMVVMLSRHGVRSPLTKPGQLDRYSAAPWPAWQVAPGVQTAHGDELIKLFGEWDRMKFSRQGLLTAAGCADAAHVTVVADTDERTRATGKDLADGMFPGCNIPVRSQADGTHDPLFAPLVAGVGKVDPALAAAAVSGRIGGSPNALADVYRPQLAALDRVLAGCGHEPANPKRTSIFDIPSSLGPGTAEMPVEARGPVPAASTVIENLLLEYVQGMSDADTGWGCIDGATLRFLMQLNAAQWRLAVRTPAIARAYASNLLDHVEKTMEQKVTGKPVPGAIGGIDDRLVILVGHDVNITAVGGALDIDWMLDGQVDGTPPSAALLFELWRSRADGRPLVRVEYTAQTLEQMRKTEPLTLSNPPGEAPIFVPGCSRQDLSCTWDGFTAAMRQAIDPADVNAQP